MVLRSRYYTTVYIRGSAGCSWDVPHAPAAPARSGSADRRASHNRHTISHIEGHSEATTYIHVLHSHYSTVGACRYNVTP